MNARRLPAVFLIVSLICCDAAAEPAPIPYAFSMQIETTENPQIANVRIAISVGGMRAIRVFSEPSHTLVAAFIHSSDGTYLQQPWYVGLLPPNTSQVMVAALETGMRGSLQGRVAATGDTHLAVLTLLLDADTTTWAEDTVKVVADDLHHLRFNVAR